MDTTVIHVQSEGPKDTIHYILSLLEKPSFLVAVTEPSANISIDWDKLIAGSYDKSIDFHPRASFSYGFTISRVLIWFKTSLSMHALFVPCFLHQPITVRQTAQFVLILCLALVTKNLFARHLGNNSWNGCSTFNMLSRPLLLPFYSLTGRKGCGNYFYLPVVNHWGRARNVLVLYCHDHEKSFS